MKEKDDSIAFLIRSLIERGDVSIEDKLVDHFLDQTLEEEVPRTVKRRTVERLQERQKELVDAENRLRNPLKLNSLGEFLSLLRKKRESATADLAKRTGIRPNKLALLESDAVSPLDFDFDEMASLIRFLGLSKEAAARLIRRSYQLFRLRPDLAQASARYDHKRGPSKSKVDAMNRALRELLLKASKRRGEAVPDQEVESFLNQVLERL